MNSGYKIEELIRRLENFADYLEDKIDISERLIIPWGIIHQLARHFNYVDLIRNLLKRRGFVSGFAALVLAEMRDEKSIPVIFKNFSSSLSKRFMSISITAECVFHIS